MSVVYKNMKFLVLVFISSIVISCSEEEKISTAVKPLNSKKLLVVYLVSDGEIASKEAVTSLLV